MTITTEVVTFSQLENHRLYAILALRQAVFIVEQRCAYQDADGFDSEALHLIMRDNDTILGYARLFVASAKPSTAIHGPDSLNHRIGRVVVAPQARGRQLGRELMQQAIDALHTQDPARDIVIGAQCYLLGFYRSLGFIEEGEMYLEDGIKHQDMRLPASSEPIRGATTL